MMGISELYMLYSIRESLDTIQTFLICKEAHEAGLFDDKTWTKFVSKTVNAMAGVTVDNTEDSHETGSENA